MEDAMWIPNYQITARPRGGGAADVAKKFVTSRRAIR